MAAKDRSSGSLAFIFITIGCVVFALITGGWVMLGKLTAVTSWSVTGGSGSSGESKAWFAPRRLAIIPVGAEAGPYARALRDELIQRRWIKDVMLLPVGQTASGGADFFICIGNVREQSRGDGLSWRRELRLNVSGGSRLLDSSTGYGDALKVPDRTVTFSYQVEGDSHGDGMVVRNGLSAATFAHRAADLFDHVLNPASSSASRPYPPQFFGKPLAADALAHHPLQNMLGEGAWLISDTPGFMRHRRTQWMVKMNHPLDAYLQQMKKQLAADGWRGISVDDDHLHATRGTEVVEAYSPEKWQEGRLAFTVTSGQALCMIDYADRFDRQQAADAIAWLFDQKAELDELLVYEPPMSRDQKMTLIGLLEQSPRAEARWWYDMAGRYWRTAKDHDKAEQALRRAYELALSEQDFKLIHDTIIPLADSLKLADLSQPMTREQLVQAGAVDLEAGPGGTVLAMGRRWVGFVKPGKDLVLLLFELKGPAMLQRELWTTHSSMSSTGSISSRTDKRDLANWHFEWTTTQQPSGWRVDATATPNQP